MNRSTAEVDGRVLPAVARDALLEHFHERRVEIEIPAELYAPGACFVTLSQDGGLRGCVGSTHAVEPLVEAVRSRAVRAATCDPRFPPVSADELRGLVIEVSVLSALEPIDVCDRQALAAALEPGVDGVLIRCGAGSATFLPQVWRHFDADSGGFLDALMRKAGLDSSSWPDDLTAWRYQATTWAES